MSNLTVNAINGVDVQNIAKQTARAWVNFNGTGVVAIRKAYNVASITDNGVGDYTVNFSTAMPDTNYAAAVTTGTASGTSLNVGCTHDYVAPRSTLALRVSFACWTTSPVVVDSAYCQVIAFD